MTTEFLLSNTDMIVCSSQNTRNGFRHYCEYRRNNKTLESRSVSYLNRTWESYEFETAIRELVRKMKFSAEEAAHILQITSGKAKADLDSRFGSIAAVAKMGEIMGVNHERKE